jgi:hypothetical protein
MQRPEALWRDFPLDPTPTPSPTPAATKDASSAQPATGAKAGDEQAQPTAAAAATASPTPSPTANAEDGRIELPGGASITYPSANGTEDAILRAQPSSAPVAQTTNIAAEDPVSLSGQAGLYVVVVAVLVVLMARWLLNHTWRAAVTVAVLLIGMAMVGLIIIRWASDLGIVN